MTFHSPWFGALLLLLPFLVYYYFRMRANRRATVALSTLSLIKDQAFAHTASERLKHLPMVLRLLAISLIIVALSRPQSVLHNVVETSNGIDIMLLVDISGSMRAEDFKPHNRLEAAKKVVAEFVSGRSGDRIGLVVFAGNSFTQCPLTTDYGVLLAFLDRLKTGMIREDGTAIGMAIANGVARLKDSKAKSRILILLTDGMNNAGNIDPLTATNLAKTYNIKIYTIGMGKRGGAPIPVEDPLYGKIYARNPDGSLVLTSMDEDILLTIAKATKGKYYRATNSTALEEIYAEIDALEKTQIETTSYMKYEELFYWFLVPGLLVFIAEIVLAGTRLRSLP